MNESQQRLDEAKNRIVDVSAPINFLVWWREGVSAILSMAEGDAEEGKTFVHRFIFEEPDGVKKWLDSLRADGRLGDAVTLLDTVAQRGPCFTFGIQPSPNDAYYILTVRW